MEIEGFAAFACGKCYLAFAVAQALACYKQSTGLFVLRSDPPGFKSTSVKQKALTVVSAFPGGD